VLQVTGSGGGGGVRQPEAEATLGAPRLGLRGARAEKGGGGYAAASPSPSAPGAAAAPGAACRILGGLRAGPLHAGGEEGALLLLLPAPEAASSAMKLRYACGVR